jgi:hypothetical protein
LLKDHPTHEGFSRMKAEHRKELQTNSLADYLGNLVRNARSGAGLSWFKVIVVLVLVLGVGAFWIWWNASSNRAAEAWHKLQFNDEVSLDELSRDWTTAKQGQAARFARGFSYLNQWTGLVHVAEDDKVKAALGGLQAFFAELAEECKDDPQRAAEAKYHLAVATETMAAYDIKVLGEAKKAFEAATQDELGKTAFGLMAQKRLDQYNNRTEYEAIDKFYREFRARSRAKSP